MPTKFANLFGPVSKILGDQPSFTSSLTASELAIAAGVSLATDVDPNAVGQVAEVVISIV